MADEYNEKSLAALDAIKLVFMRDNSYFAVQFKIKCSYAMSVKTMNAWLFVSVGRFARGGFPARLGQIICCR